jgi:hypothetical protein
LTTNNYRSLKRSDIKYGVRTEDLFEKLRKYPPSDPLFIEVDFEEEKKVVAWLRTFAYEGNPAQIYHVILYDDSVFPEQFIGYYEIDTSDEHSKTALTWVRGDAGKQNGPINNWQDQKDPLLELVVGLLNFAVFEYQATSIPLEQIIENKWDLSSSDAMNTRHDPQCAALLDQLNLGKIKLTIGTVPLDRIQPYSYETCFKISLHDIEFGLERIDESCLLVYYQDGKFIASDDYVFYMALRIRDLPYAKVAVMGHVPKKSIKTEVVGGKELLPNVLRGPSPVSDDIASELNENVLSAFITQMRISDRASNWAHIKCVVLTEDQHGDMLNNLLESSGMHPDEIRVMSYEGCTHVGSLSIIIATLKQIKEDLKFVVHRDADYLSSDELKTLTGKIERQGATALITTGTDIESYYLNAEHIHFLYGVLPVTDIDRLISTATTTAEQDSLERLRKQKYRKLYDTALALNDQDIPAAYFSDVARYRYGKRTLGFLKSALQSELGENPELCRPSPFLFDSHMRVIADQIWPDKILPWN